MLKINWVWSVKLFWKLDILKICLFLFPKRWKLCFEKYTIPNSIRLGNWLENLKIMRRNFVVPLTEKRIVKIQNWVQLLTKISETIQPWKKVFISWSHSLNEIKTYSEGNCYRYWTCLGILILDINVTLRPFQTNAIKLPKICKFFKN